MSIKKGIRMHSNVSLADDTVSTAVEWMDSWLSRLTGNPNATANGEAVGAALGRYFSIHASIFGPFPGRLPPLPTSPAAMARLNCTVEQFLQREGLGVLHPLFYQFFVMQGMGLLSMPAYYGLKVPPSILQLEPAFPTLL